ncbi:MAG: septum formation inhibitor Maf [Syntrophobacterales bacterium]|nr:septum formation inhibitor Maf [Syntrophobacterales bacterium]
MLPASIILASASPRRQELLKGIGIKFDVIPSGVNEDALDGETPRGHVLRLSKDKSFAVSQNNPDAWVLGADTAVIIDGEVLGKPGTQKEARIMLKKLSGREHRVITGFTIVNKSTDVIISDAVESSVLFKKILEDEMNWYVKTEEPYDKAGGYAVQGMAAFFVREIHGSYTNVIGLPLMEVVMALRRVGALVF